VGLPFLVSSPMGGSGLKSLKPSIFRIQESCNFSVRYDPSKARKYTKRFESASRTQEKNTVSGFIRGGKFESILSSR